MPAINQFVGRGADLDQLWTLLRPEASIMRKVVVLHGLGGIGKTQLAIRFARLHADEFSAIFWLPGKNKKTLMRSLAACLPKLPDANMETDPKTEQEIEQAVGQVLLWLATPHNSKWLLVFDNIDKYSTAEQPDGEAYDVTKFFSSADHGSIIITTRVLQITEVGQSHLVQKLPPNEATTLLINSAGLTADSSENLLPLHQGKHKSLVYFI